MPCRVGITTNPGRRKQEILQDYPVLRDWQVIASRLSREDAQRKKDECRQANGWDEHPRGNDPELPASWCVYFFRHD